MTSRPLYGGAITCSLPPTFLDASDLRQIPDPQEVFLSPDSDLSLIVEVLELVSPNLETPVVDPLEAAIKFHFSSLAHDNSASSEEITSIALPPSSSSSSSSTSSTTTTTTTTKSPEVQGPIVLKGFQTVSKFNKPVEESDVVLIQLALWRIPDKNTDLTLCVNFPVKMGGESGEGEREKDSKDAEKVFEDAVRSFEIKDFELFAG